MSHKNEKVRKLLAEGAKMTNTNSKPKKHLTLNDRIEIQDCLYHGMTFKAIGERICKDQTSISKEIKKHIQTHTPLNCPDKSAILAPIKARQCCNTGQSFFYELSRVKGHFELRGIFVGFTLVFLDW